jgi:hypothetical protein
VPFSYFVLSKPDTSPSLSETKPFEVTTVNETDAQFTWVTHTEYIPGEPFEVMVRLANYQGYIIPANCTISLLNPDMTYFVSNAPMTYGTPFQDHYYTGITGQQIGAYEILANCTTSKRSYLETNSFHVSNLSTALMSNLNISLFNLTAYLAGEHNATDQLIIQNFNSTNNTLIQQFQNTTSTLQTIINLLLFPCQGNNTLTTTGLNSSRVGEPFYIKASIVDKCGHPLSNYTCTAQTGAGFWGMVTMPYVGSNNDYEFSIISTHGGTVNWQVTCT